MTRFPDEVITAMHNAGSTVTCMPVHLDDGDGDWESAIFFVLPPSVTDEEIKQIFPPSELFGVGLELDLMEHDNGTLIELGISIDCGTGELLQGLILFLTGHIDSHFQAVTYLGKQSSIGLFIGDVHCNLLHQQRIPLGDEHRQVFRELLQDAAKRDFVIRMTGKYDPDLVFAHLAGKA